MQHDSPHRDCSIHTVVGIDVSKATLDCHLDPSGQRLTLANDEQGIAQLLDRLRSLDVQLVLLEATGRLHRHVASELLTAGVPVALVNPQRCREYARSIGRLEKPPAPTRKSWPPSPAPPNTICCKNPRKNRSNSTI